MTKRLDPSLEFDEDILPDVVQNALQDARDNHPVHTGFAKSYLLGHSHLHVVFDVTVGQNAIPIQLFGLIEHSPVRVVELRNRDVLTPADLSDVCDCWARGKQSSMLVYVFERVEHPESVQVRCAPSVVRLDALERVLNMARQRLPNARGRVVPILRRIIENGELNFVDRHAAGRMLVDDVEGEVIKRDAHVVERVSNPVNPSLVDLDHARIVGAHELARVIIVVEDRGTRLLVPKGLEFLLQGLQVALCPVEDAYVVHGAGLEVSE